MAGGVPQIDFSILGDLGKTYKDARSERMLSDLGKGLASGELDYKQAAGIAAEAGKLDVSMSLMKLGREQESVEKFNKYIFGDQPTQQPQPAPQAQPMSAPQSQAGPVTTLVGRNPAIMPAVATDAGVTAPSRPAVQPTARTWGDKEAEAAGLYEPARPRQQMAQVVQPQAQQPQPQQPSPLTPTVAQNPAARSIPMLMAAVSSPGLPAPQRELAGKLLEHALKSSDLPEKQKNYVLFRSQGGTEDFTTWDRANSAAGSTKVSVDASQKGDNKFEEEMGKDAAKRYNKYIDNAEAAEKRLVDINTMREIHNRAGSQGQAANIKEAIGPYAEALGVNITGLSDIQAYSQVIQRLAPQQRAPGSGSTSDIEFKGFLKSLPGLNQNPAAREVGLNTMESLARDEMARGEIASRLSTKEITRGQAEKELRTLPDPMKGFTEWRKANPELYGMALKGSGSTPQENPGASSQQGGAVRVNSPTERAALPRGTRYIAPDGTERVKQ